jgi:two-component system sensor kinase FixL
MDSSTRPTAASREVTVLLSASPRPVLLLSPDLTVVAASDNYLATMGVARDDLIGRDLRDVLSNSDSLNALVASVRTALRTRKTQGLDAGPFRAAADQNQGHQRLMEVINSPVLMDDGEPFWIIMSCREVSQPGPTQSHERLATEVALQAAEARLRSILRTVPDAMIIIDERGLVESISTTAEKLFGYSADEVVGRNVSLLMPSPHREQHDGYLARYLKTGERHIIGIGRIVVGQRKDGTTFPMHLTVGELRSAEKHHFTGFIRDLTDQVVTENRLKELQSEVTHMSRFTALGETASTLAHEINQPLTAINNYLKGCHRLLQGIKDPSAGTLRDAVGKAADQALRAGQIIRRLGEFVARGDSERRVESFT